MAVCVCVIGKDNGPIYMRSRSRADELSQTVEHNLSQMAFRGVTANTELQYNFIVSSALDIIEERALVGSSASGYKGNPSLHPSASGGAVGSIDGQQLATRELYLGALTAREEYKVYGYMTNTKIKFVIVIEETSIPLRENDIRTMFRKLHSAFCDLMSNPFYLPGSSINSKRFDAVVTSIMSGQ
ncbi:unnamed protein product [Orchesella dallaii]|uniref:Trafficking protein particle complex subunit 2-like protein n=1 Tax=Orchesella dallaii TaxID=48710 RepID=A0ABP1QC69_9HEXA